MTRCGCTDDVSTPAASPLFKQTPTGLDIRVVAGDSFTLPLTINWPMDAALYPGLYVTSQVRSVSEKVDGYFTDASEAPQPLNVFSQEFDPKFEDLPQLGGQDIMVQFPELYVKSDNEPPHEFSKAFGKAFNAAVVVPARYIPVGGSCSRSRVYLTLLPMMTRHLFGLWDGSARLVDTTEEEGWHCYHLPPDANVSPTASGYPDANEKSKRASSWESAVSLPVWGGEYDNRSGTVDDGLGYQGHWDLQLATTDGKFVRTILSGLITVTEDVTRKVGIDV